MSHLNIIRAWKDEAYRQSLSEAERARLPENPAGLIDLASADLERVTGGQVCSASCKQATHCYPGACGGTVRRDCWY
jgi:mersacidin/lichenicidin family type 2 lantibiotic